MHPLAILLLAASGLAAVDTAPIPVVSIESGSTMTVLAQLGGQPCPVHVRLGYLMLIGDLSFAKQKLSDLCPPGSKVVLHGLAQTLSVDEFGFVQALVYRDFASAPDPALATPVAKQGSVRSCIQYEMARAGWAKYWSAGADLPPPLRDPFIAAEKEGKDRHMGSWSLPAPADGTGSAPPPPGSPPAAGKPGQF